MATTSATTASVAATASVDAKHCAPCTTPRPQTLLRQRTNARLLKLQCQHTCTCDACSIVHEKLWQSANELRIYFVVTGQRDKPLESSAQTEPTRACHACGETLEKLEARVELLREVAGANVAGSLVKGAHGSAVAHTCGSAARIERMHALDAALEALAEHKRAKEYNAIFMQFGIMFTGVVIAATVANMLGIFDEA